MFTWRGRWIGAAGWQTGALSCGTVGLAGAARNSSGGCREQHEVCCSWWSFPGLFCVVADGAAATGRLPLLVAEKFVSPTKFSGTMYKAANRECVGRSHARASGRRPGRRRILTCFRCVVTRDRSPLPVAWELRAPLVGAGVALDLSAALSGARRGIASVLCVMARLANRRGGALRRRKSWSGVEEQGQAGLHRAPGATDPGWIEDAARSRRSATRSTASAAAPARIITRRPRWPVFDPQLSRRGDRCRPRCARDGVGCRPSAHPRCAPHHLRG